MEPMEYLVVRLDGDYALLRRTDIYSGGHAPSLGGVCLQHTGLTKERAHESDTDGREILPRTAAP